MKKVFVFWIAILLFGLGNHAFGQGSAAKDVALKTIGTISGAYLYNTYMTIGTIADGHNAGTYTTEMTIELMDEQIGSFASLENQYTELRTSGFVTDMSDIAFVNEIISAIGLLKKQAEALIDGARNNWESGGDEFEAARVAAWDKIAELLGIE